MAELCMLQVGWLFVGSVILICCLMGTALHRLQVCNIALKDRVCGMLLLMCRSASYGLWYWEHHCVKFFTHSTAGVAINGNPNENKHCLVNIYVVENIAQFVSNM